MLFLFFTIHISIGKLFVCTHTLGLQSRVQSNLGALLLHFSLTWQVALKFQKRILESLCSLKQAILRIAHLKQISKVHEARAHARVRSCRQALGAFSPVCFYSLVVSFAVSIKIFFKNVTFYKGKQT